jgi:hypothetical protein
VLQQWMRVVDRWPGLSLRHRSVASACADFERSIAGLPHVTLTTKLPGLTAS